MDQASTQKPLDLLLKGGHVIDPANEIDGEMDVGIAGQEIARVVPIYDGVQKLTQTGDAFQYGGPHHRLDERRDLRGRMSVVRVQGHDDVLGVGDLRDLGEPGGSF